ncbi:hypothetical protein AGMMS49992_07420 [Clostridia bacterium]|nr:hypothetical protein AGMMS49992_07420 [Clostridia bacterium]
MTAQKIESKASEIQNLKRAREELDAEIAAIEDELKDEMRTRDEYDMRAGAYRIRWAAYTSTSIDTTAMKRELPEIAARYTKTKETRRFTIN